MWRGSKSQSLQRLRGPQCCTMAPGLTGFKRWAVFDRGYLFSVGLSMVAPCLAVGPMQCDRFPQNRRGEIV